MGMGYRYAGSASYSRFDEEITKVAEILGGKLTPEYQKLLDDVNRAEKENSNVFYAFGTLNASAKSRQAEKYEFPEGFDTIVKNWLNHPYNEQTVSDTVHIWEFVREHPKVKEVSHQIWYELEQCGTRGVNWYIC